MTEQSWRDRLAGARMAVDREFGERVRESDLTSQEWSLVMTAVEFDIEGTGEDAHLVADTSKVEHVVPEFDNLQQGMPSGGSTSTGGGGFLDTIKSAIGLDDGVDDDTLETIETLTAEYAERLQAHLEEEGRWADIREAAQQPTE